MKNNKIAFLAPLLMVICAVGVLLIGKSYSASDTSTGEATGKVQTTNWYYVRRNMYSHYYVSHNSTERDGIKTASGTILIKNGDRTKSNDGAAAVAVYCAQQGYGNSSSAHTRYTLAKAVKKGFITNKASKILDAMMKYAYPYITLTDLKEALKNPTYGLDSGVYDKYSFDKLNAQEAMTAVQASIWNATKNKDNYYKFGGTLSKISSRQSSFALFGAVNWQSCAGYRTGSGLYKTILTSEEEEWYKESKCDTSGEFYKNVFKLRADGNIENRVNTLVKWYANLYNKVTEDDSLPNVTVKSSNFQREGDTLTLNVTIDSENHDYEITFKNQAGDVILAKQKATGDANGNTFTIKGLPATTTIVTATVDLTSVKKNVYYYWGSGQDWIGVNSGNHSEDLTITNQGSGQIDVYKVANQSINVEVSYSESPSGDNKCGAGCLPDAKFILYANDKKTIIDEFTSSDVKHTTENLADGTYYLYELDAPYGYTKYKYNGANVDSDGYIKIDISNGNAASVVVNNDVIKVCFKKIDSVTKEVIDGVELQVEDAEGSVYEIFTTSSQQGNYCLPDGQLESGYYYLNETVTPSGYGAPDRVYKFSVGDANPDDVVVDYETKDIINAQNVNGVVTVENKPGTLISKSDITTGACVAGAHLIVKDSEGKQVDEWTSSCEDGKDTYTLKLDEGKYTLIEETAPDGYATASQIEFSVDASGKVSTSLEMKDDPINVCFMKVSGTKEGIPNAEFTILDSEGKVYKTFKSTDTDVCFQRMPVGKYTIRETKAPEGYEKLEKDIEIEVKDTKETQTFKINNETTTEKTAQNSSQLVIIIASIFMVFGLGLVGYYGYKKQS